MMTRRASLASTAALLLVAISGCAAQSDSRGTTVEVSTIDFDYPTISAPVEEESIVLKSGIAMSAMTVMPKRTKDIFYTDLEEIPALIEVGDTKTFELTSKTMEYFESDHLSFEVECTNTTNNTVNFEGSTIEVRIDGEVAEVERQQVDALASRRLEKNESESFSVPGPKWDALPDGSVLELEIAQVTIGDETVTFSFEYSVRLEPQQLHVEEQVVEKDLSPKQRSTWNKRIAKDQRRSDRVLRSIRRH